MSNDEIQKTIPQLESEIKSIVASMPEPDDDPLKCMELMREIARRNRSIYDLKVKLVQS